MASALNNLRNHFEWGVAARPLPGETESGDQHLIHQITNGALVAVVDGLGHGEEAAMAARAALCILKEHPEEAVVDLLRRCHEGLRKTRGVVMTLASFDVHDRTVTWLGVGNVEAVLLHADGAAHRRREAVLLRGGVVGHLLPTLRASVHPLSNRDLVLFATDGIQTSFASGLTVGDPPQRIADRIMVQHSKATDDALVLVLRYRGADQ